LARSTCRNATALRCPSKAPKPGLDDQLPPLALPALRAEQRAGRSWEEPLWVPQLQARLASAFL